MKERGNPWLHRADRWLGIPLVFLVGAAVRARRLFSRTRSPSGLALDDSARPLSFTLLKSAAIGDTVMLSAVIRDMRAQWPSAIIRVACGNSNAALARMIIGVDEVVVIPMSNPLGLWRARDRIRGDVFIDFDSWPRINALISHVSRSAVKIGFRTTGQYRHAVYDRVVDHSFAIHESENYRNLVRAAPHHGVAMFAPTAVVLPWLHGSSTAPIPSYPFVVLHMFSGGSQSHFKEWPATHWKAITDVCLARGFHVLLSGGPADRSRNDQFRSGFEPADAISVLPVRRLDALMPLLAAARAVVSVDTGIAHLAGAADAPTIVLYGPTSPSRWGVMGRRVTCIKDSQTPWINLGFERSSSGKTLQLSVAQVLPALLEFIDREPGGPHRVDAGPPSEALSVTNRRSERMK